MIWRFVLVLLLVTETAADKMEFESLFVLFFGCRCWVEMQNYSVGHVGLVTKT